MLVVDRSLLDREGMGKHKSSRFPSVRSEAAAGPSKEGQRAKERERERVTFKSFTITSAGKRIWKSHV